MKLTSHTWISSPEVAFDSEIGLVLAFGPRAVMQNALAYASVREAYPGACIVGASTGGEIVGESVRDGALVTTGITFDSSGVEVRHVERQDQESDSELGARLGASVPPADSAGRPLVHVFVLADGISINGSALAVGMEEALPPNVSVTGGLAGDGDRFEKTILWADHPLEGDSALALAFYGDRLRVGVGAAGGWNTFGVQRQVTKSSGNVLEELDGKPALDLYERYLGPAAAQLPASGLQFPLAVRSPHGEHELVRTLLGIDREARTLTFAGDIPEGSTARLMRSNPDNLIDGALQAARDASEALDGVPQLGLMVSCVGRKWAMGERIEEEVEEALGALSGATAVGFYAYGELAPAEGVGRCQLHNQTMTITAVAEV